jgi:hypothetical protein
LATGPVRVDIRCVALPVMLAIAEPYIRIETHYAAHNAG